MEKGHTFLLPVRRRLMAAAISYLAGIYMTQIWICPLNVGLVFCALFASGCFYCSLKRRRALFFVCALLLVCGNTWAGCQIRQRDLPTKPKSAISGTVSAIESGSRVYLEEVIVEGADAPKRPVLVTLMTEEDEIRESVRVGQRISGIGRLFEQDEARNPGDINQRIQALCEGYELSGYILPGWQATGNPVFSLRELMRKLRLAVLAQIETVFGEHAPLFQGIMMGERDGIDSEVLAAMRLTGTVHVLTVSGLHLSMIAMVLSRLLRKLPVRRWTRFLLEMIVLAFFTCLTGAAPGTIRALIMACIRSLAMCRGRQYEPLTALSAAALVMTAFCPLMALSASFQFSFFTVLGILLLGRGLQRAYKGRRNSLAGALISSFAVSASAQIAAVPMQALLYGYVPLLSLPMNLVSGMCMPLLMLGGWLTTGASLLLPEAAGTAAALLSVVKNGFEALSVFVSQLGGILRIPAPYAAWVFFFALFMALCSSQIRFGSRRKQSALLVLTILVIGYIPRFCPAARYVQLDVGQGDGAVIRKGRRAVLVDVGPASSYSALRYLRHEGLFVDTVILSHLDEDHAGALATLLRSEVEIGEIIMPLDGVDEETSSTVLAALSLAREKEIPMRMLQKGDVIEANGMTFDMLSPDASLSGSNERSLVIYTDAEGTSILTTGDLPSGSEMEIVPDCDLLKVAHHGSKNATSLEFLRKATPEIALISVGSRNSYGHPAERVLDDLASVGADVYRTDQSGCVTVWLEENNRHVSTYLGGM